MPSNRIDGKDIELPLFDLQSDVGETTNVADKHPDVVERLKEDADQMRKDLGRGRPSLAAAPVPGKCEPAVGDGGNARSYRLIGEWR